MNKLWITTRFHKESTQKREEPTNTIAIKLEKKYEENTVKNMKKDKVFDINQFVEKYNDIKVLLPPLCDDDGPALLHLYSEKLEKECEESNNEHIN